MSYRWFYRAVRGKLIPSYRFGAAIRVRKCDLDAFAAAARS
jgi:excisionase family DNA binding protein